MHYRAPGGEHELHASITADVSAAGLFVQARRIEAPGTRLDLDLELPEGPILLKGIVVWAKDGGHLSRQVHGGFGVWLLDPPAEWKGYVAELIRARATSPRASAHGP